MLTDLVTSWLRATPLPQLKVRVVRDVHELPSLRPEWTELHRRTPHANFFQSFDWFALYWEYFGSEQQLHVILVEDANGEPIGILPLTIAKVPSLIGAVRRLMFPLDNWGTTYGPIGARAADTLCAAFHYLRRDHGNWDILDLRWLPANDAEDVREALQWNRMAFEQRLWARTAQVDLRCGWSDYWSSRSSKWRNNQRRCDQRLAQLGQVRIEHLRPSAESPTNQAMTCFDTCEQIAVASWQGSSASGNTLNHERVRDFLRRVHAVAAASESLYISLLWVGDLPAAYTYNYLYRGIISGVRMGYDPKFASAGAGSVLLRETIKNGCDHGDHTFDLGESPSPYKRHLANKAVETVRFTHCSPTSLPAMPFRIQQWIRKSTAI
jgi:CelD/BcsL family acetyltransferase involved in cellulose biosynthesis